MDDHTSHDPLRPKYRRVVLKLSGEGLGYPGKSGINIDETLSIARQAKRIVERGVQLATSSAPEGATTAECLGCPVVSLRRPSLRLFLQRSTTLGFHSDLRCLCTHVTLGP